MFKAKISLTVFALVLYKSEGCLLPANEVVARQ